MTKTYELLFPVGTTGKLITKADTLEEARAKFLGMLDEPYFLEVATEDAKPNFQEATISSGDGAEYEELY